MKAEELAALIDHTLLKPDATETMVRRLCAEARQYGFAAVCVNPVYVKLAAEELKGSPVRVATVVGFPLGATFTEVKVRETALAVAAGAAEIDMVIDLGALKDGRLRRVEEDVAAVVREAAAGGATVKAILETTLLTEEEKVTAARLAVAAGAAFVKTSTGFGPGGATVEDVRLLKQTVGDKAGVKASGGIRTAEAALAMVAAGASRIGTSAGVAIMEGLARRLLKG